MATVCVGTCAYSRAVDNWITVFLVRFQSLKICFGEAGCSCQLGRQANRKLLTIQRKRLQNVVGIKEKYVFCLFFRLKWRILQQIREKNICDLILNQCSRSWKGTSYLGTLAYFFFGIRYYVYLVTYTIWYKLLLFVACLRFRLIAMKTFIHF